MKRKRLTELMPFLLPLRIKQKELFYYTMMKRDGNNYAHIKTQPLSENVITTVTHTINHNSGFDIKYQLNKLDNLKIIAKTLNGIIIRPNETFSFNRLIYDNRKEHHLKEGLVIVNGKMEAEIGGGICHMSNQLYHSFLHTPLTIVERHSHNVDYFPPKDIQALKGIDATISSGWLDLKVKNETSQVFQVNIHFNDEDMIINILSDKTIKYQYVLRNENIDYVTENDLTYKKYDLIREVYEKNSLNKIKEEHVATDKIRIAYDLKEELI